VIVHRVIQILLGGFCAFMIWGGGFFWLEFLPNNFTKTTTYTLYSTLPPPPKGPTFCSFTVFGQYGVVMLCNYQPPFVWWLQHRYS
jgi:hypothetical protein